VLVGGAELDDSRCVVLPHVSCLRLRLLRHELLGADAAMAVVLLSILPVYVLDSRCD
jgi:hypothetical protein